MEIPEAARKCPHCHHFQTRAATLMFHPGFMVLCPTIPLLILLFSFVQLFDKGEDYEKYRAQIVIEESELAFGDTKSGPTVAVLGTVKNTSPVPWREITFHADFFDADGRRVDVGQREAYSMQLPSNAASSFKVSFRREFPETNYVRHEIRVVAAQDARSKW
jgi:hypothetical protein